MIAADDHLRVHICLIIEECTVSFEIICVNISKFMGFLDCEDYGIPRLRRVALHEDLI